SACRSCRRRSSAVVSGMYARAERVGHGLQCTLDVVVVDVEMSDRADHARLHRPGHANALTGDAIHCLTLRQPDGPDVDLHEVRLHELEVDGQPGRSPALCEPARPRMIFGEAVDVVVE